MRDSRESGDYMTCVLLLTALSACALAQTVSPRPGFSVFSATSFTSQPDLTPYGLKRITVVHPDLTADVNNETSLAERSRLSTLAQLANESTGLLVIDIEEWPLVGNPSTVAETVKKYRTALQLFKTPAPTLKVGLYSVLPIRDYWNSLQEKNSRNYIAWQKENDRLASIAQLADVLFPSIYTFYEDRIGWQKYAIAQIQEARRYAGGKPVYVFLWPQYHVSNKDLANVFLPGDYWRMELETARQYADGVVIWCCSNRQTWNEKAPWWLETLGFLREVGPSQQ
jgi:hypothetical protein